MQNFKIRGRIISTEHGNFKVRKNGKMLMQIGDELIRVEAREWTPPENTVNVNGY